MNAQLFFSKIEFVLKRGLSDPSGEESEELINEFIQLLSSDNMGTQFLLWIDSIDELEKLIYFANLIKARCNGVIDVDVFKILLYLIKSSSVPSLQYIERLSPNDIDVDKNYFTTSMYYLGIIEYEKRGDYGKQCIVYKLAELGFIFKKYCLNYNGTEKLKIITINDINPVFVLEPYTNLVIQGVLPESN